LLTVPVADTIELLVSFAGYSIPAKKITAKQNLRLDIFLEPTATDLGEVIVSAQRNDRNRISTRLCPIGTISSVTFFRPGILQGVGNWVISFIESGGKNESKKYTCLRFSLLSFLNIRESSI
jgi:hypothetical protein